jgi:Flp pilus assembly protein TadD
MRRSASRALRLLARYPHDRDTLGALLAYARQQGNLRQALQYGRRLAELDPGNPQLRQLVECLEAESRR